MWASKRRLARVAGRFTGEIARRRTFAIISHPDAGKTTLTELSVSSAVMRFEQEGLAFNLLDTPGH